jgi:hypothetical protein
MKCLKCHAEYNEGFDICAECQIPLVPDNYDETKQNPPGAETHDVNVQAVMNLPGEIAPPSRERPTALIILIVLTGLHILLNVGIFIMGVRKGNDAALFGGLVSSGVYIAIFFGLIKMQEWARILLIWLCYVGIVASLLLFSPLEIITLIFAHRRSVREATKNISIAKLYTYHETIQTKKEQV